MNKTVAWTAAGVVHVLIIGAMVINFTNQPKTVEAFDAEKVDLIKATTIDESQIKAQQEKIKKKEQDKKLKEDNEKKRLEELKRQVEKEKERIALVKKKELEEKKRKEKEKRAQEQREKEEADKQKKKEEQVRIEKEKQALDARNKMDALIEQEERLVAEQVAKQRTTTIMGKYTALIRQAIYEKLRLDAGTESWRKARFNIKLSSSGDVLSVRILESSGSQQFDRNAETSILQASPLPLPPLAEDEQAHNELRNLNINIKAEDAR